MNDQPHEAGTGPSDVQSVSAHRRVFDPSRSHNSAAFSLTRRNGRDPANARKQSLEKPTKGAISDENIPWVSVIN
jgi:hypothetical protein